MLHLVIKSEGNYGSFTTQSKQTTTDELHINLRFCSIVRQECSNENFKQIFMTRRMKVYEKPGSYSYTSRNKHIPEMRIGGVWLSKAGFNVNDQIELIVEENQIVIRHSTDETPTMFEEAPGTVIPD
jgi:hypothetical protein